MYERKPDSYHLPEELTRLLPVSRLGVPLIAVHFTWSSNTIVLTSVDSPIKKSNFLGSARIGMRPSRCDKTSSGIIEVLLITKTVSMAIVGTSAMHVLRMALTIEGAAPIMSNSAKFLPNFTTCIFRF